MSLQTLFTFMLVAVVVMAWWANVGKRNKIYCSFRRVNKTKIDKFVKMDSRYVVFDKKKYDIVSSCITFVWWDKGLVHFLFPQWVATLDFTWNNRWPHDPNTQKPVIISPEVRNAMNKEEWVKSYAKGFTPPTAKKQTLFQQYLPMISVLLVVVVGLYLYNNMQALANQIAIMQNSINAITR